MRTRRLAVLSCCIGALWLGAPRHSGAESGRSAGPRQTALPRGHARSIGTPSHGALVGGVALRERTELRLRWPDGPRWALPALVAMLERAAVDVDRRFPGSVLLVGDLSRRDGGSIAGHASHENGRDADVGFYYLDDQGRSVRTERLLPVVASGSVPAAGNLRFDEARNWALIESFLTDSGASIQSIFVAESLEHRLIDYARQHGTRRSLLSRARSLMRQTGGVSAHDDHFHVRIACPVGVDTTEEYAEEFAGAASEVSGGPWPAASLREPLPSPRESAGSPSASWASPHHSERRSRAAMLGPADSPPASGSSSPKAAGGAVAKRAAGG